MKIVAIRLKNLTSIEGLVEIDFTVEPLKSAGIFAISGQTGAGKSTLLDALCLALYDKAPRFAASVDAVSVADVGENLINQSDVRNMLRRGTAEGFAEVDFIGTTGFRYRANWSVRRARGKVDGRLASQVMSVKNLDTAEELQGTKTELLSQLSQLIGLTYDQFTRTVLLAQNDFATFLKSRGAAKAELLEKLTGTDIYSRLSQEVYNRHKACQEEVNTITTQMGVIELLPDEAFTAVLKEREELKVKRLKSLEQQELWKRQWDLWTALSAQEELFAVKQRKEGELLKNVERLEQVVVEKRQALDTLKAKWEAIQPDLKRARELDVQLQGQITVTTDAERTWTLSATKRNELQKKHEQVVRSWNDAFQAMTKALEGVFPGEYSLEEVEAFWLREEEALVAAQQRNDQRADALKAFNYQALIDEQKKREAERKSLVQRVEFEKELARLARELIALKAKESVCLALEKEKNSALEAIKQLYDQARLATGKDVKLLRSHLHEGEACPVCGSTAHPYREESDLVDTLYQQVEQAYNNGSTALRQASAEVVAVQRDWKHNIDLSERYTKQLEEVNREIPEGTTEGGLRNRLTELEGAIKAYRELEEVWRPEEERLKKQRTALEQLQRLLNTCKLAGQQERAAKAQWELMVETEKGERGRYDKLAATLQTLREQRSGLLKGMRVDEAEGAVLKHEKEIVQAVEEATKASDRAKTDLFGLRGELKQVLETLNVLRLQRESLVPKEELAALMANGKALLDEADQQLSRLEAQVLQQEKGVQRLKQVKQELEVKEEIANRWAKLNKLIGSADGTKFKVIAQGYTLNLLLMHANHHLSYLSKRYRLEQVPDTLGLQVVDGEMCDEVRPVYSLSGGESFLVSLALALGLSSLSSNNLKVESLFIDEGFGSLDADSLRTAMEALEQLQLQGRKIGVISHVQEMSERLSVQVQVHKKVNGKSGVTIVG
ncbi:MAG: ATP-dependent endonuclease [Bacteroidia bacterium]|nr:ATP-dependent endonuclease [Bacteroidia bacterium]